MVHFNHNQQQRVSAHSEVPQPAIIAYKI